MLTLTPWLPGTGAVRRRRRELKPAGLAAAATNVPVAMSVMFLMEICDSATLSSVAKPDAMACMIGT